MEESAIRILLVEDSVAEARLIREHVNEAGASRFRITHMDRLAGALESLDKNRYDIVLLDLNLPDSSGPQTLAALCSRHPQQAIVVLTGLDDEAMGVRLVQEGAEDYLVKNSIDCGLLVRAIRYAIERKKGRNEKEMLEERLRQAQKLEAIGALAGGIAHDFNNLLGAISGYADLMKDQLSDNPKLVRYSANIAKAAARGAHLTGKLLSFARRAKIVPRRIDMHSVLTDLEEVLSHTIDPRVRIKYQLRAPNACVIGDTNEMTNAVLNLAINARDAMPDGGTLTFATACRKSVPAHLLEDGDATAEGGYLEIRISDTGLGMSASTIEHAFDPFFTTKETGKGTGLGLASVYGCMKQHNGFVTIESELGNGTTFKLYLPLDLEEEPYEAEAEETESTEQGSGKILLVDDEAMIRECASEMLSEMGYEVVSCKNGKEALDYYQTAETPFDLVVLDLIMPVMNGVDCFRKLRRINPFVRIVVCAGYDDSGLAGERMRRSANGFLRKPFKQTALRHAVADALSGRKHEA